MDKWWNLILEATKKVSTSGEERRQAIIRAGRIAQAYEGAGKEILESIFGEILVRVDGFDNHEKSDAVAV